MLLIDTITLHVPFATHISVIPVKNEIKQQKDEKKAAKRRNKQKSEILDEKIKRKQRRNKGNLFEKIRRI